ncbi:hypothetical protein PsAD13_05235 [Pseudovibrio sp. Ad13]|nr:hypothetical protein PsAD13_05235 [Pseudovibrio sp. Ad13]
MPDVFGVDKQELEVDIKWQHAKIEELALENNFLEGVLTKPGLLSAKKHSTPRTNFRFAGRPKP